MKTLAPGVEGVDHHLAVDRAGDLHPPVLQVWPAPGPRASPPRRTARVSARKSGRAPASSSRWRSARRCSSAARRAPNSRCRRATKARASVAQDLGAAGVDRPADLDALTRRDASHGMSPSCRGVPRVRGPRRSTAGPLYSRALSERPCGGAHSHSPWEALVTHRLVGLDRPPARRRDYPPGRSPGLRRPARCGCTGPDQPRSPSPAVRPAQPARLPDGADPGAQHRAPSPAQIARAVTAIRWYLSAGMPVAVHNGAGPGPAGHAGTVVAGYLVAEGASAEDAAGGAAGLAGSGRGRLPGRRPQRLRHARAPGGRPGR